MTSVIRHCPKCGALQADQARCSICAAAMSGDASFGVREILGLASPILIFLSAFVLVAILVVSALVTIFH